MTASKVAEGIGIAFVGRFFKHGIALLHLFFIETFPYEVDGCCDLGTVCTVHDMVKLCRFIEHPSIL